jgi:hypothetical protein
MSPEELMDFIRAVLMTPQDIERLIILFSDHRLPDAAGAEEAVALLRPYLPEGNLELCQGEVPDAVGTMVESEAFPLRFPVQAALPKDEQAAILAATAAVVLRQKAVDQLREKLRDETDPDRPGLTKILSDLVGVSTYLHDLEYPFAPLHEDPFVGVPEVVVAWVHRHVEEFTADPAKGTSSLEKAFGIADFTLQRLRGWGDAAQKLSAFLAQAHCTVAVQLANESHDTEASLRHMKSARDLDRGDGRILLNYLRACDMEVTRLAIAGQRKEAKTLATVALAEAERSPMLLQEEEGTAEEIRNEIESIEEQKRRLDREDPPGTGPLRTVRLLDDDE